MDAPTRDNDRTRPSNVSILPTGSLNAIRRHQGSAMRSAQHFANIILDYNGMLFFDYCGDGGNEKIVRQSRRNRVTHGIP